jgi:nucleotide-binding universal stress UspA family protein
MAAQAETRAFNRILVTLDSSRSGQSALEAAALLAEAMEYELVGLFVEDSDLMTLASLPFSREVLRSGVIQNLDPAALQKEMTAHAAAARHAMRQVAVRHRLRWSFRSVRGDVGAAFTAAAAEVDILCIGRRGPDRYRRTPLGSPIRMALDRQSPVLVAGQLTNRIDKPVAVIVDRSAPDMESIRLAGRVAAKARTGLVVLEFLPLDADVETMRKQVKASVPAEVTMRTVLIGRDNPCGLLDGLRRNDYSLVVYGVGRAEPTPAWLDYVADAGECPLLLVPEAGAKASPA